MAHDPIDRLAGAIERLAVAVEALAGRQAPEVTSAMHTSPLRPEYADLPEGAPTVVCPTCAVAVPLISGRPARHFDASEAVCPGGSPAPVREARRPQRRRT